MLVLLLAGIRGRRRPRAARGEPVYLSAAQRSYGVDPDGLQARYDAGPRLIEAVRAAGRPSAGLPSPAGRAARARFGAGALRGGIRPAGARRHPRCPACDGALHAGPRRCGRASSRAEPGSTGRHARSRAAPDEHVTCGPACDDRRSLRRLGRYLDSRPRDRDHGRLELRRALSRGLDREARRAPGGARPVGHAVPSARRGGTTCSRSGPGRRTSPANRLATRLGSSAVGEGLRRLGMTSSTYPGALSSGHGNRRRRTKATASRSSARDDGTRSRPRALPPPGSVRRQPHGPTPDGADAASGAARLVLLLDPERGGGNLGLLRPWLGSAHVVEKNGWLADTRITAAIVYGPAGATIVVVEAYRPGLSRNEATALGRRALEAIGLR